MTAVAPPAPSQLRYLPALGLISAIGAFSVDMYLPAFPRMAAEFMAPQAMVQLTLTTYAIAVAVGQLIYGPTSDMFGRKAPLYAGLVLYCLASIGCALSPNVQTLLVMRFFQGLGSCSGIIIGRAMVRDLYRGPDAVKMMASLLLILGISPILAPMCGSAIATSASWRWVFGALTLVGLLCIAISVATLPESHPPAARDSKGVGAFFHAYLRLFGEGTFLARAMVIGLIYGVIYAWLAGASLMYKIDYNIDPNLFSLIFASNAVGFIGTAQFTPKLVRKFGPQRVALAGCAIAAVFQLPLAILTHFEPPPIYLLYVLMFIGFGSLGLILGPTTVLAMESQHQGVGAASALLGTIQFGMAAITAAIVSVVAGPTEAGMFAVISGCSLTALALGLVVLRKPAASPV